MADGDASATGERRYGAAAIALHWTIAVLVLVQIGLGWYFNHFVPDHSPEQDWLQDLHVQIGLSTMILIVIRIGVRLSHPAPPLPPELPAWEQRLAHAGHLLFYVLLLAMPLTGWAMVSSRHEGLPFWGLEFPRLPGLMGMARPARHLLQGIHTDYLVWIALANLVLHVAGALKHQLDGHPVLWRMLPILARPKPRAP